MTTDGALGLLAPTGAQRGARWPCASPMILTPCPPPGHARPVPVGADRPVSAPPEVAPGLPCGGGAPAAARCPRGPAQWWAACPFLSTWRHPLTPPATAPSLLGPGWSRGGLLPRAPGVRRAALPSPDNVSSIPGHIVTHADRLSTGEPLVSLGPAERLPPRPGPRAGRLDSGASPGAPTHSGVQVPAGHCRWRTRRNAVAIAGCARYRRDGNQDVTP
jgi:hypothetical protein